MLPRRFEVGFGSDRSAPELQRGLPLGDGLYLSGKIDRIDVDPFSARGIVQDYKSGRTAHSAKQIDEELKLQIPLYMLVLRDLVGIEPLGGVYRALAGARVTRGLLHAGASEDLPGFQKNDYLRRRRVLGARRDLARARARVRAAHPRGRRQARPEGRHVPVLVRPLDDVPGASGREQPADSGRRGDGRGLRLRRRGDRQDDGARRAVRARGLRRRARRRVGARDHLHAQGGRRAARAHPRRAARARPARPRARGSTARGSRPSTASARACCARIRSRSGIDPRFHELDDEHGAVLRGEAFERALAAFCATRDPERLRLLATYGAQGLRRC